VSQKIFMRLTEGAETDQAQAPGTRGCGNRMIKTERLHLRPWTVGDADAFAALHADPEVMWDYGAPFDRATSDAKFARYLAAYDATGHTRWAVEDGSGSFVGYVGIMLSAADHPLGFHCDIGWRLSRAAWGKGYATEAARAALADFAASRPKVKILAYTQANNLRSRAVIGRLRLTRVEALDFQFTDQGQSWACLVWTT